MKTNLPTLITNLLDATGAAFNLPIMVRCRGHRHLSKQMNGIGILHAKCNKAYRHKSITTSLAHDIGRIVAKHFAQAAPKQFNAFKQYCVKKTIKREAALTGAKPKWKFCGKPWAKKYNLHNLATKWQKYHLTVTYIATCFRSREFWSLLETCVTGDHALNDLITIGKQLPSEPPANKTGITKWNNTINNKLPTRCALALIEFHNRCQYNLYENSTLSLLHTLNREEFDLLQERVQKIKTKIAESQHKNNQDALPDEELLNLQEARNRLNETNRQKTISPPNPRSTNAPGDQTQPPA